MPFPYLYDPTGLLPANAITDELHHVAPPVDLDRANFIVPRAAPYFATGLVIRTGVTVGSPTLVEGVDYIYTHHFVEASQHLSTPVYGSIMFLNRAYVGDVYVSYHTLGGAYTLDDYGVVETLTRSLYNIRTVTWDQLIGVPALFPVVPHPHDVADLTGMSEVVTALTNIITAIQGNAGNIGSLMSTLINHIDGISSHNKAQVGLPYLENYGMAGTPELTTRPTNKYVSPAWVWSAIELFNLGEAGVSQASETVVGITRYATDVEVADQDNPLDNVAVSAAGMWLAIATNTERLAGATIVTGVDFNTPPYREDGYWAFTNAINTSITPSSGYICTKKAGTKAYQTETLDNGEISNRMYTGTTWTPWVRAYVATYNGSIPVTTLAGNIDLNDYTTPGFYTFDTHNIIGHAPPTFGTPSLHEMMVYAGGSSSASICQVALNLTINISAIRYGDGSSFTPWSVIDNITGVLPSGTTLPITAPGVWLVTSPSFKVLLVTSDPVSTAILNIVESPPLVSDYNLVDPIKRFIDDGLPGRAWGSVPVARQYVRDTLVGDVVDTADVNKLYQIYRTDILSASTTSTLELHLPYDTSLNDKATGMLFTSTSNNINTPPNLLPNRVYLLVGGVVYSDDGEYGAPSGHRVTVLNGVQVMDLATNIVYFNGRLYNLYNVTNETDYGWTGWILKSDFIYSRYIRVDEASFDALMPHTYTISHLLPGDNTSRIDVITTTYSGGIYQKALDYHLNYSAKVRVKPTATGIWSEWDYI